MQKVVQQSAITYFVCVASTDSQSSMEGRPPLDQIVGICRECVSTKELQRLFETKDRAAITCYTGFEPSGRLHIAQAIITVLNFNTLADCGIRCKIWIADYFAELNGKFGGDVDKISVAGRYMIEVWKACGLRERGIEFVLASDAIRADPTRYWEFVMDVARRNNLKRMIRCCQIMGRKESDDLSAGQIMYVAMQTADIFFLGADMTMMGNDQRKVNMLAREYAEQTGRKKPIILSHVMLPGLLRGQQKMAKSDPNSAIFMDDDESTIAKKIRQAYCPPNVIEENPCITYIEHLVMPFLKKFVIDHRHGITEYFYDIEVFKRDYADGRVHPGDLKAALTKSLDAMVGPVRLHFQNDENARRLLEKMKDI